MADEPVEHPLPFPGPAPQLPELVGLPPGRALARSMLGPRWREQLLEDLYAVVRGRDERAQIARVRWLAGPALTAQVDVDGRLTAQHVDCELELLVQAGDGTSYGVGLAFGYRASGLGTGQSDLSYVVEVREDQPVTRPSAAKP